MDKGGSVLAFTEGLSELLNSGMDLSGSLAVLDGKIAAEVRARVDEGEMLSVAVMTCRSAVFPDWYVAFVSAAESRGSLAATMAHLSRTLSERRSAREKFVGAVAYPLFIVFLTAVCAVVALLSYSSVFSTADGGGPLLGVGVDYDSFRNGALRSCAVGAFFLAAVAAAFVAVLRRCLAVDPCVSLFRSLSFLSDCGVPVVDAIDCSACVVEDSPRLCAALVAVKSDLMEGGNVPGAFGKALSEAGFMFESRAAFSSLSVAAAGGNGGAFSKVAEAVEKRSEKWRKTVLSFEQPVLLCAAAVFLAIVMKSVVGGVL